MDNKLVHLHPPSTQTAGGGPSRPSVCKAKLVCAENSIEVCALGLAMEEWDVANEQENHIQWKNSHHYSHEGRLTKCYAFLQLPQILTHVDCLLFPLENHTTHETISP